MFHKFLSMLLCACMLTGSVSNAAYAMSPTMNVQTTEVAEETEAEAGTENVVTESIPKVSQQNRKLWKNPEK